MNATTFLNLLKNISEDELKNIKGVGPILAKNMIDFTQSDRFEFLTVRFAELEAGGIELDIMPISQSKASDLPLNGKSVVITGTFEMSRDIIKQKLEELGAKVSSQVSSNTTYLLAGDKAGSKLTKAEQLGVMIVRDLAVLGVVS